MKRRQSTAGDGRTREQGNGALVLVVEGGKTNAKRALDLATALGYRVHVVDSPEEAAGVAAREVAPDVIVASIPGAELVVRAAVLRGEDRPSVLLSLPADGDGIATCSALGADGWISRPYKRDVIAAALRSATLLRAARRRAAELEERLSSERGRFGEADPTTGFYPFETFRKLLELELKRARRYKYPLAACLVAIDGGAGRELHDDVARVLRPAMRDIDLPVDYAGGRFLAFLPHTDLPGADRVGRRLEEAVRSSPLGVTVSIGIAAVRKDGPPSFARLIRDATVALRAAQLKGGGQVVVRAQGAVER